MISDPFIRNLLLYIGSMFVGALAAGLGVLMVQLAGTDPIVWRPVFAAALGPIVTGLLARQLTRAGSEGIKAQVDALRADGVHRDDMVVLDKTDAVAAVAGTQAPPVTVAAVADELERRRAERVAARLHEVSQPPAPASVPDHIVGLIDRSEGQGRG